MLEITSPIDGTPLRSVEESTPAEIVQALDRARSQLPAWRRDYERRAVAIKAFRDVVARDVETLAMTLTLETGKPIAQSRNELRAFLARIDFFLAESPACLATQIVQAENGVASEEISFDPLGVIGCISAWNYPYFVGGNVFIPALLAGNAVLYKPSEHATLSGLEIARCMREAGIPESAFTTVVGAGAVGARLTQLDLDGMFFTGSAKTGLAIAGSVAGRPMPLQLELGGKDAVYVCDDVSVQAVASAIADGAFYNAGQSCCSVERIYVHSERYDEFLATFLDVVREFRVGDPRDASTYIGPLARAAQVSVIERQIEDAVARGGRVALGGRRIAGGANYFEPTVLVDVPHDAPACQEETFGPLVVIAAVDDDRGAVELMNDSAYGLTAGVYSRSRERAKAVLSQLDVGSCYWNACDRVSPRLPWSGRRGSGIGVTLSTLGIRAFLKPRAWHWVRAD